MPKRHLPADVGRLAMALPDGRAAWAYLLEDTDRRIHLIDCGADLEANRTTLRQELHRRGRDMGDIASVTGTHAHFDHFGMAAHLRDVWGAKTRLHRRDAVAIREGRTHGGDSPHDLIARWGVPLERRKELLVSAARRVASGPPVFVDRELEDGDDLGVPGWDLVVLATPGHTPGHICIVDTAGSRAFVGDHVLSGQNPGVGLGGATPESPGEEYISSLERLLETGVDRLLPGHGSAIADPALRISEIRRHHLRRRAQVAAVHEDGESVWATAGRVHWSGGWAALRGMRLFSALRQVEDHVSVTRDGDRATTREEAST